MEDRDPRFFLSFRDYDPDAEPPLNRHGPLRAWASQQDLRVLVAGLQRQGVKVAIGFWNYGGWLFHRRPQWLRDHPELRHVPFSSHLYPFARLEPEGMEYCEYIARQYERLRAAFGFDGLMLGDGLCGFGSIWDPDLYSDKEDTIPQWTHFYRVIADVVHRSGGVLLAYDQMGFSFAEARKHGVDYRDLAQAGLDILVYQSYPQAWGRFWLEALKSRFDLTANAKNLVTVKDALAGTTAHVFYTVELGDSVEKWPVAPARTAEQIDALDSLSDGRFLVWGERCRGGLDEALARDGGAYALIAEHDDTMMEMPNHPCNGAKVWRLEMAAHNDKAKRGSPVTHHTSRLAPPDPSLLPTTVREIFADETQRFGAPLNTTLVWAHHPALLAGYLAFRKAMNAASLIPERLRYLVYVRVASLNGCPF